MIESSPDAIQALSVETLPDMDAMDAVQSLKRFFYNSKSFDTSQKYIKLYGSVSRNQILWLKLQRLIVLSK